MSDDTTTLFDIPPATAVAGPDRALIGQVDGKTRTATIAQIAALAIENGAAPASHTHSTANVTGLDAALAGKAAASHTHPTSEVTGLDAALAGKAATMHAGAHASGGTDPITPAAIGAAPASHTHSTANVTGLDAALAGKAAASHTHPTSEVTGLDAALAGKAATVHTHTADQISDFPSAVQTVGDARYNRAVAYQQLTDGANIAWNVANGVTAHVTLGANRTLSNPTNLQPGATYVLQVRQDAAGGRTLSYGNIFRWLNTSSPSTAPTLSTGANARDLLSFFYDGTYLWGGLGKGGTP